MQDARFEQILEEKGITFHYDDRDHTWWLRQARADGKTRQTQPAEAGTREEAEAAALKFIQQMDG